MLDKYLVIGSSSSLLWVVAGVGAALVFAYTVMFCRGAITIAGLIALSTLVFLSVILGTSFWALRHNAAKRQQARERTLEWRIERLNALPLSSAAPFACLNPSVGERIQLVCEKEVFASPATVAREIVYVGSQFTLLVDLMSRQTSNSVEIAKATSLLQQSLETDRFGLLAYWLVTRDGCTGENCNELAILSNPTRVRLNLRDHTFDHYIEKYREAWTKVQEMVGGSVSALPELAGGQSTAERRKELVDSDFPTADSFPPVHIMTPDATPAGPATNVGGAATADLPSSDTRTGKGFSRPVGSALATDPVWTPGPTPAPPTGNSPSALSAPLPLNPFVPSAASK